MLIDAHANDIMVPINNRLLIHTHGTVFTMYFQPVVIDLSSRLVLITDIKQKWQIYITCFESQQSGGWLTVLYRSFQSAVEESNSRLPRTNIANGRVASGEATDFHPGPSHPKSLRHATKNTLFTKTRSNS